MLVIKIKFSFSKPEIHNPHAASYLSGVVTQNCGRRRPIALVSLVNTKGWKNSLMLQLEKKHGFPPPHILIDFKETGCIHLSL